MVYTESVFWANYLRFFARKTAYALYLLKAPLLWNYLFYLGRILWSGSRTHSLQLDSTA